MRRGDRIVAESSWNYALYLYPRGLISSLSSNPSSTSIATRI